jgi:Lrp/AsnC family leucine-responsive transcriptional regulator
LERNVPKPALDAYDWRIIDELQRDGRATNQALAERIGLSPSPCLRRVRMLENVGVITRYVALIDPQPIGLTVTAFVRVRLDQQGDRHLAAFEAAIADLPEVMECYLMTGESDYQLRILVPSLADFENFLRHKLTRIEGVSQVTSSFALRPIVYRTALPMTAAGA